MSLLSSVAIFGILVFLDRITKYLALVFLTESEMYVLPCLNFSLAWNRGVSWGVFGGASSLGFYLLSLLIFSLISAFFLYSAIRHMNGESILFELFVLAGAVSNFFDRIYYGAVIDFIDCHALGWHWPTFNIADACIVVGIGAIILREFLWKKKKT